MPPGFGRLPFLTRRSRGSDRDERDATPAGGRSLDADSAAVGPPALLPAMIYREVLFDASEMTPAWARPRERPAIAPTSTPPVAAQDAEPSDPAPPARRARTARAKPAPATSSTSSEPAAVKPKRTRKARPANS
jgi:hypothetical protein